MTFYEAALRVLEEAGGPLHVLEITKRSIDKGLLSHTGKTPDLTMLARLAAMARRPRDRKLMVSAKDTFALTDWMLPEDADALAQTGVIEPNPEENLPPLRPVERHPEPRSEFLRSIGRQSDRRRRDDEGKKKKYPPIAEVVFELLTEAGGLPTSELLARMKSRELAQDDLGTGALLEALAEDNQRRLDDGRRPQFAAARLEGQGLQLSVEEHVAEGAPPPVEAQAAFCQAAGLPFENGRVVLKAKAPAVEVPAASPEDLALVQAARQAAREAKRAMARVFRKKLSELDAGTFEKACVKLLHAHHFRELKVAKRGKEGPLLTARRRDGSLELRFAVRVIRGGQPIERRQVQELRRDLGHYAANAGLLLTAGEARGDARSEATQGTLVSLWCGDQLAEKFFEGHVGVSVTTVELYDVDDGFFEAARVGAEEAQKRREERHKDRDRSRGEEPSAEAEREAGAEVAPGAEAGTEPSGTPAAEGHPTAPVPPARAASAPQEAGDEGFEGDEGGDEGEGEGEPEEAGAAGGEPRHGEAGEGGRRRRRRRRRRRGGGGGGPAGPGGPGGGPRPEGQQAAAGGAPRDGGAGSPPPPPPPTAPTGGGTPSGSSGA